MSRPAPRHFGESGAMRPEFEQDAAFDPAFQHKLEQFNPGMVWLDRENKITALNDVALQVLGPAARESLGAGPGTLIGIDVLQLHPPKSREKVEFLLRTQDTNGQASVHPHMHSPPPLAMMINIPDRMLLIKVSRMVGTEGAVGTCMIFYDLTEVATASRRPAETTGTPAPRLLSRIPVYRRNRILLVDVKDVGRFEGEGHYTSIVTAEDRYLCNLSMSVLESRLDPDRFLRIHRSHIINLDYAAELIRVEEGMQVAMPEGMGGPIPVSKNKLQQLKDFFGLA